MKEFIVTIIGTTIGMLIAIFIRFVISEFKNRR